MKWSEWTLFVTLEIKFKSLDFTRGDSRPRSKSWGLQHWLTLRKSHDIGTNLNIGEGLYKLPVGYNTTLDFSFSLPKFPTVELISSPNCFSLHQFIKLPSSSLPYKFPTLLNCTIPTFSVHVSSLNCAISIHWIHIQIFFCLIPN